MNEVEARTWLEHLLQLLHENSITYEEPKMSNGDGFVEIHMKRIHKLCGDEWDERKAEAYIKMVESRIKIG